MSLEQPQTYQELQELDKCRAALGPTMEMLWMSSKRRAEILRTIGRKPDVTGEIKPTTYPTPGSGPRVPLIIYRNGKREVIGDAVLESTSSGLVSKMEIRADAGLELLQVATDAFSIGFAPPEIDDSNMKARPSRWQQRRQTRRKK